MSNIVQLKKAITSTNFAELVKQRQAVKERCLLLDTSGSMSGQCDDGRSQYSHLLDLVENFPGERKFSFNNHCSEITDGTIPKPTGGTAMCGAFACVKGLGVRHAVLITDGAATDGNDDAVLLAAQGLKLDVFYVGPGEAPPILAALAKQTGGQFGKSDLKETLLLTEKIKGLLT